MLSIVHHKRYVLVYGRIICWSKAILDVLHAKNCWKLVQRHRTSQPNDCCTREATILAVRFTVGGREHYAVSIKHKTTRCGRCRLEQNQTALHGIETNQCINSFVRPDGFSENWKIEQCNKKFNWTANQPTNQHTHTYIHLDIVDLNEACSNYTTTNLFEAKKNSNLVGKQTRLKRNCKL